MRKHRLVDCSPRWVEYDGRIAGVRFDCPEGHAGCHYTIPFTPALDGYPSFRTATWARAGDTFETLTLSPSIRGIPKYSTRGAAIADGCLAEHVHPRMWCALHIFIRDGRIEFCGDSR